MGQDAGAPIPAHVLSLSAHKAAVRALTRYPIAHLPTMIFSYWQQNDFQACMEITVLQSSSCRRREGLGWASVCCLTSSDIHIHLVSVWLYFGSISKLSRTGSSPGKLSPGLQAALPPDYRTWNESCMFNRSKFLSKPSKYLMVHFSL